MVTRTLLNVTLYVHCFPYRVFQITAAESRVYKDACVCAFCDAAGIDGDIASIVDFDGC